MVILIFFIISFGLSFFFFLKKQERTNIFNQRLRYYNNELSSKGSISPKKFRISNKGKVKAEIIESNMENIVYSGEVRNYQVLVRKYDRLFKLSLLILFLILGVEIIIYGGEHLLTS